MSQNVTRNSTKKQRALIGLVTEKSVPEAARAAGISSRSLYRWLQDDEFRMRYLAISQFLNSYTINYLRSAKISAMDTIKEAISDKETPLKERGELSMKLLKMLQTDETITPTVSKGYHSTGSDFQDPLEHYLNRPCWQEEWDSEDYEALEELQNYPTRPIRDLSDQELEERWTRTDLLLPPLPRQAGWYIYLS